MPTHRWRRGAAGLSAVAVAAGVLAVTAAPAAAHVTVAPEEAAQGSMARVDFRAPTESDTLSTTGLEVHFPEDPPIPSVLTAPVPGWTVDVTTRTLDEPVEGAHGEQITEVVESITWTAENEAAEIRPGEFGEFPVSMGPMPEVDEVFFRALQTYSDDTVVRWIELPAGDDDEPALPAASLRLVEGDGHGHGHGATGDAAADDDQAGESGQAAGADDGSSAGVWLGLGGLLAGLAGLVLGGLAFLRTRAD
ncbi:YcnI family protein [Natronosporangium hydrolyticum]|uniref:YcnI family protein n=1 Tax=Natronosporangium hydrolyticum TaxID=2811111 RepID=A0A895Y8V7_9ACTN|nr:YcnI family protein [Natronosporangium hydrolyticum]QSB13771.1 YcnI family protein [Natronosporangium hydrolyticum]